MNTIRSRDLTGYDLSVSSLEIDEALSRLCTDLVNRPLSSGLYVRNEIAFESLVLQTLIDSSDAIVDERLLQQMHQRANDVRLILRNADLSVLGPRDISRIAYALDRAGDSSAISLMKYLLKLRLFNKAPLERKIDPVILIEIGMVSLYFHHQVTRSDNAITSEYFLENAVSLADSYLWHRFLTEDETAVGAEVGMFFFLLAAALRQVPDDENVGSSSLRAQIKRWTQKYDPDRVAKLLRGRRKREHLYRMQMEMQWTNEADQLMRRMLENPPLHSRGMFFIGKQAAVAILFTIASRCLKKNSGDFSQSGILPKTWEMPKVEKPDSSLFSGILGIGFAYVEQFFSSREEADLSAAKSIAGYLLQYGDFPKTGVKFGSGALPIYLHRLNQAIKGETDRIVPFFPWDAMI